MTETSRSDGKRNISLRTTNHDVELVASRNGFSSFSMTLDNEMLEWLYGVLCEIHGEQTALRATLMKGYMMKYITRNSWSVWEHFCSEHPEARRRGL